MPSLLQDLIQTASDLTYDAAPHLLGDFSSPGPLLVEDYEFNGGSLPLSPQDASAFPVSDPRTITSSINVITDVNVWFRLENELPGGAFNGDYYMRLEHDSGYAILLNRVGRRTGADFDSTFGYADNGFNVTLDDQASAGDIHVYRLQLPLISGGPPAQSHSTAVDSTYQAALTGTWAPDGRDASPTSVTADLSRTKLLSQFNGMSASGTWTLYVADLNSGGTANLVRWGMQISGLTMVPEPANLALGVTALLAFVSAARSSRLLCLFCGRSP